VKLNLGAGAHPQPGWVNLDMLRLPGIDVVHDLDNLPWPFDGSSAETIRGEDVFEHVADPIAFMAECHRILEPGGHLLLRTTYWKSQSAYTDPTHKRFCTELTFDYWCVGTEYHARYGEAYAQGRDFMKIEVLLDDMELEVHLVRLPIPDAATISPA
jgi:SAM-dependent methyltransferase